MTQFEWDKEKELENIIKHGINFDTASRAFDDPSHLINIDHAHSQHEFRYLCIGKVNQKTITVRFTYRFDRIRIIGAGYWRKGRKEYEKKEQKNN